MKKIVRTVALILFALAATSWSCLQFQATQNWLQSHVCGYLSKETGSKVVVGRFGGIFPFWITVHDVTIDDIAIDRVAIVPSWFELIFGKISCLYVSAKGIDLRSFHTQEGDTQINVPSFSLYALSLNDIKLPRSSYAFLLNEYGTQEGVECLYFASGKLSWDADDKKLKSRLTVTPYAGDDAPYTVTAVLYGGKEETSLDVTLDAKRASQGSAFISLPCDELTLDLHLKAHTDDLLHSLNSTNHATPLVTGSWNVSGLCRETNNQSLRPMLHFTSKGACQAKSFTHFSFLTNTLSCHKLEPLVLDPSSSSDPDWENLMGSADDTVQDPRSLTRISELKLPSSIEGNLELVDSNLVASIGISSLTLGEQKIPSCWLSITSSLQEGASRNSVQIDATLSGKKSTVPFTFSCDYVSGKGLLWDLPKVSISCAGHTVSGALKTSLFPLTLRGRLTSENSDAANLGSLFGCSLSKLACNITFDDRESPSQKIDAELDCEHIIYNDWFCKKATLFLTSSGPLDKPIIHTGCSALKVENGPLLLDEISLDMLFEPQKYSPGNPFKLKATGSSKNAPLAIDCQGSWTGQLLTVRQFRATAGGHTLHNLSKIEIIRNDKEFRLQPFELASDSDGKIHGMCALSPNQLYGTLNVENFPLECLDPFFGELTLFGPISGHLELSGKPQEPQGICTLASSQLRFWNPEKLDLPELRASCTATLDRECLHLTSQVEGLSLKKPTIFELMLPVGASQGAVHFSDKKPIEGYLQAEFDPSTLLSAYLDEDELVEGIVQIDATFAGTASHPTVTGTANLSEGKLFIPALGTLFNNIQMQGRLLDNQFKIDKISATDGNDGTLEGSGWVKDLLEHDMNFYLEAKADNFCTIALDEAQATTSGSLEVSGDMSQTRVKGSLDVIDAELTLAPQRAKDVPKLDITYTGIESDEAHVAPCPFQLGFDIDCTMEKVTVRGLGLESAWKGKAHLQGINSQIDVDGSILLTTGTLNFVGKAFALTHGSLEFHGDLLKKSQLRVVATNDMGQLNTEIMLQGPLESPRISLQSNPAMPQKEILSWLLFNKSSTDISPLQGLQLGQAALQISGAAGDGDIIEQIKQKLHIDRLDFGQKQTARPQMNAPGSDTRMTESPQETIPNEVSLQVGKYISDGIIVTLTKDVTNEVNRVGVEANITKHITAEAYVGDDAEAELSLEWRIRY